MAILPKGGGGKPEEEKTVTAGTSVIEVLPSGGKTMKKVTVNPTPSQSKTVSPSTSQQTVSPDAGKLLSQVIVNEMASGALSDITVSSAGLITAQVGTSGYLASGTKKTKQLTTQAAKTWTPTTADQSIASGRYLTGKQTINGDSNLLAANIKSGVSIFGVAGSFAGQIMDILGCTEFEHSTIKYTSETSISSVSIPYSLSKCPKFVLVVAQTLPTTIGHVNHIAVVNEHSFEIAYGEVGSYNAFTLNADKIIADQVILNSVYWSSNGIMFSTNNSTFYYTENVTYDVYVAC